MQWGFSCAELNYFMSWHDPEWFRQQETEYKKQKQQVARLQLWRLKEQERSLISQGRLAEASEVRAELDRAKENYRDQYK